MKVPNEEVRSRMNMDEIITQHIKQRHWKLRAHVFRKSVHKECCEVRLHTKIALTWTTEGRHSRGGPRETWRRTLEKERGDFGV